MEENLETIDYRLLEDEGGIYCPEIDPSLDQRVIADRKTLLNAAFGKNKRKQRKALQVLDAAYGMTSIFRKGYGTINIQEALNGKA